MLCSSVEPDSNKEPVAAVLVIGEFDIDALACLLAVQLKQFNTNSAREVQQKKFEDGF